MNARPSCSRCGRTFANGEVAYQQDLRVIEVKGTTVTQRDVVVVVCEPCSAQNDDS